jgi:hypothetical protein
MATTVKGASPPPRQRLADAIARHADAVAQHERVAALVANALQPVIPED